MMPYAAWRLQRPLAGGWLTYMHERRAPTRAAVHAFPRATLDGLGQLLFVHTQMNRLARVGFHVLVNPLSEKRLSWESAAKTY